MGSLWLDRNGGREYGTPAPPDRCDVVVIGGGLAGLCTALYLHRAGMSVTVLEAGEIAGRTTGHTTAKITALHDTVYSALRDGKGAEAAATYARVNSAAVGALTGLIGDLGIECSLVAASAYTCASTAEGAESIVAEAEAARSAGLAVEVTTEHDLPLPIRSAVRLDGQAHFDPVAFCRGLTRHLADEGVAVVGGARVTGVEEDRDGCTTSGPGFEVRSEHAVLATHLPIVDPAFIAARSRPERSYVVAGRVGGSAPEGMYVSCDAGWSVRPWTDRDGQRWLLVGGEGHPMVDGVDAGPPLDRLAEWARAHLGLDATHRWSAFDYVPVDGVPFIGRLSPNSHRRYVATGFAKWGMTTSVVAATLIADAITGRGNEAAALFDATRMLANVGRDVVAFNAKVAKRFAGDRVRRAGPVDPAGLAPGEGEIRRRRTHFVAVSRDSDGVLRELDAACTHLGCLVEFNAGEQTWDCPCHGSRFALDGSVIDGPATAPLGTPADP